MTRSFHFYRLGEVPYADALTLQEKLVEARTKNEIPDTILMLEHPSVITLGRSGQESNLLLSRAQLHDAGYEIFEVGRGGDVTFHGPGQLVMYPIINLSPDREDVRKYVWTLEETMIRTAADFGVQAERIEGLRGIWVQNRKIGAVGVRISRWITMHGMALNVTTDLSKFQAIIPCGITDKEVTSLSLEIGKPLAIEEVLAVTEKHFAALYDATSETHAAKLQDFFSK